MSASMAFFLLRGRPKHERRWQESGEHGRTLGSGLEKAERIDLAAEPKALPDGDGNSVRDMIDCGAWE